MTSTSTSATIAFPAWQASRPNDRPAKELSFGEFAESWYQRQLTAARGGLLRPSAVVRLRSALTAHLLPFFAARPLSDVTRERCDAYRVLALNVGCLTPATINSVMDIMHVIMRDAHRRGLLPVDPLDGMYPLRVARRLVEPYDRDELKQLIRHTQPSARVVVALAALAGLRQGEIFALRVSDVDWEGRVIDVSRSLQRAQDSFTIEQRLGPAKTPASARRIPVQRHLQEMIQTHLNRHVEANRYGLLCSWRGRPWEPSRFYRNVWAPALTEAGLRPMRFHDLRRSFIAQCVSAGIPPTQTAAWLGHATSRMTDYYFTSGRRQREGAIALLDAGEK